MSMTYASIDAVIDAWAQCNGLTIFKKSGEDDIRNTYISSPLGECFQIWIDPPASGQVMVHVACVEGKKEDNLPEEISVPVAELATALQQALHTINSDL